MTFLYTTNFTVSIDASTPVQFLFTHPLRMVYNFSVYDIQLLQFGPHNLDLMFLDSNDNSDHNSNFLFDYASVNETVPPPGATTSLASAVTSLPPYTKPPSTTTSVSIPTSKHSKAATSANSGSIAGGVLAGLVVLACLLLFYRRRAHSRALFGSPPERNISQTEATLPSAPRSRHPAGVRDTRQRSPDRPRTSRAVDIPQGTSTNGPTMTFVQRPPAIIPTSTSSLARHNPSSEQRALPSLPPSASIPPRADGSVATAALTTDQLNLLHRLSASNTPGPVLAAVAQSMVLGSQNGTGPEVADNVDPPPEYSAVRGTSSTAH